MCIIFSVAVVLSRLGLGIAKLLVPIGPTKFSRLYVLQGTGSTCWW